MTKLGYVRVRDINSVDIRKDRDGWRQTNPREL
jgi:hypothetical protein